MKGEVYLTFLTIFMFCLQTAVQGLTCYECEGGPTTICRNVAAGMTELCPGSNDQCYEAYVKYQNGALNLFQRGCWTPPKGSKDKNFCNSFNNPNGQLVKCRTCKTDLCNKDKNF